MAEEADLDVELSRTVRAPAAAREALRDLCGGRVGDRMLSDAKLLTSELVTNALRHGDGRVTLRASLTSDRLRVEVVDRGSRFERELRRRDFEQVGGWGLGLVEDIATRWGVHEGTTHVWFEIERHGPRLGENGA